MRKFIQFIFLAEILLCSCHNAGKDIEITVDAFPIEQSLSGVRIDLTDAEYLTNSAYFAGDYLVFHAIKDKFLLQIYDREFNLVDKLLSKGEGPDELPDVIWQGQWTGSQTDPDILVYCEAKRRVASLALHPFEGLTTICDIPVSEWVSPTAIYQTTDTTLVGITLDMVKGADLFSYNTETQKLRLIPSPFQFADGAMAFYTSQQIMDFNRKNLDVCCAYNSFPTLVFYDKNFNIIRKVNVGIKVNTETLSNNADYPSFCKVAYYNDFILAMLIDGQTSEANLLVFEPNGDPYASYAVGKSFGFIVDEFGQRLLTVKYDDDEDLIYLESYPMPELTH